MNGFDLSGRKAIVTGGGQGIGRAVVERFAASGAEVSLWDIDPDRATRTAEEIGRSVTAVAVDVSDAASIRRAAEIVGPVDILVNNAAVVAQDMPWTALSLPVWQRMVDVNLFGILLCMQAIVPGMTERGYGRVVNIASMSGKEGTSGMAAYSAVKAGVIGFTKAVARELAPTGVLVNCIAPSIIQTEGLGQVSEEIQATIAAKSPLGRMGKPEEVAALVTWLASEDCSYSTGFCHDVSGGRATY